MRGHSPRIAFLGLAAAPIHTDLLPVRDDVGTHLRPASKRLDSADLCIFHSAGHAAAWSALRKVGMVRDPASGVCAC